MAATRPRRSLLELFDPLEADNDRDTASPDSDKENAFDAASLFGQPTPTEYDSPVKLRRRLVDVGDITTDDPSLLCMLTDEEELEEVGEDEKDPTINLQNLTPVRDNVKNPQSLSSFSIMRTPLRELQLEQENSPVPAKTFKRALQPTSPLALSSSTSILPTISEATGISSIIDRVNTSGVCFASPNRAEEVIPTNEPKEEEPSEAPETTPEVIVAREPPPPCDTIPEEPLDISLGDVSHFESTPAVDARLPPSTLRQPKADTSANEINRRSMDLQTSFQIQLQSEDASFDLLKDKISFFNSPGNDGDDTFDMSTEMAKMQQIIAEAGLEEPSKDAKKCSSKPTSVTRPEPSPKTPLNVFRPAKPERQVEGVLPNAPAKPASQVAVSKPPVFIPPPSTEQSQKSPVTNLKTKPSIPALSRRSSLALKGPAIPGLRIVKKGHEKSASTSSVDPVVSSTPSMTPATHTEQALVTGSSIEKPVQSRLQRRVSVGLMASTKPGTTTSTTGARRLTVADRGRTSANPPVIQELGRTTITGPRRAPVSQGSSATTLMNNDRGSLSKSKTTTGPRRVPITAPAVNPTAEKVAPTARKTADTLGGVKPPLRSARPSIGGTSTLPRPSLSRLPAPGVSGIARPSLGSVGRAAGTAVSGKTTISRRTVQ